MGDCANITARNSVHFGSESVVNLRPRDAPPAGKV